MGGRKRQMNWTGQIERLAVWGLLYGFLCFFLGKANGSGRKRWDGMGMEEMGKEKDGSLYATVSED